MSSAFHPKCGRRFPSGNRAGHCAACCETFIGQTAFEAHRVGEHGVDRRCIDLIAAADAYEMGEENAAPFWTDERGYWHHGAKLTDEQKAALYGKAA